MAIGAGIVQGNKTPGGGGREGRREEGEKYQFMDVLPVENGWANLTGGIDILRNVG